MPLVRFRLVLTPSLDERVQVPINCANRVFELLLAGFPPAGELPPWSIDAPYSQSLGQVECVGKREVLGSFLLFRSSRDSGRLNCLQIRAESDSEESLDGEIEVGFLKVDRGPLLSCLLQQIREALGLCIEDPRD